MIRTSCAVPASARIRIGTGRCFTRSHDLRPAPRRQLLFGGEQAADVHAEQPKPEIHDDQRQQEVRDREADEAEEGEDVVAERVLPHRRVDADRQCQSPGDDDGAERQQHGQPQPVADDLGDRPPVFEREAEVAAGHHGQPLQVLHPQRLVRGRRRGAWPPPRRPRSPCPRRPPARRRQSTKSPGGRWMMHEGQHRDRADGDRRQHQAAGEVGQHLAAVIASAASNPHRRRDCLVAALRNDSGSQRSSCLEVPRLRMGIAGRAAMLRDCTPARRYCPACSRPGARP